MEKYRKIREFLLDVYHACVADDPKNADDYRVRFNIKLDGILTMAYLDSDVTADGYREINSWRLENEDEQ